MNINWQIELSKISSDGLEVDKEYSLNESSKCPIYALGTPINITNDAEQIGQGILTRNEQGLLIKIISLKQ